MRFTRRDLLRRGGLAGLVVGATGCLRLTSTETPSATRPATEASPATRTTTSSDELATELERVRDATARYREGGIERALRNGFEMLGPARGAWPLVDPSRVGDGRLSIASPEALQFVEDDGELVLAGVGYTLSSEQAPLDEPPPDLFSDDGADLRVPEANGWTPIRGTFQYLFSDGDDEVDDPAAIPRDELTDPSNWGVTPDEGLSAGDEFDLDGDGETEVLDVVRTYGSYWALRVWCHRENPDGLFVIEWPTG